MLATLTRLFPLWALLLSVIAYYTPSTFTPVGPWVTYFTGSYAMHGAPWRSSFGWSGYGGSHGCVNMPVDAAKFIYDWTDMGDTVVVHY